MIAAAASFSSVHASCQICLENVSNGLPFAASAMLTSDDPFCISALSWPLSASHAWHFSRHLPNEGPVVTGGKCHGNEQHGQCQQCSP